MLVYSSRLQSEAADEHGDSDSNSHFTCASGYGNCHFDPNHHTHATPFTDRDPDTDGGYTLTAAGVGLLANRPHRQRASDPNLPTRAKDGTLGAYFLGRRRLPKHAGRFYGNFRHRPKPDRSEFSRTCSRPSTCSTIRSTTTARPSGTV